MFLSSLQACPLHQKVLGWQPSSFSSSWLDQRGQAVGEEKNIHKHVVEQNLKSSPQLASSTLARTASNQGKQPNGTRTRTRTNWNPPSRSAQRRRQNQLTSEASSLLSGCSSSAMADAVALNSETLLLEPSAPIPATARSRLDRTRGASSTGSTRDARVGVLTGGERERAS
jgi:hypothetical protein